jgi:hypothetical protein
VRIALRLFVGALSSIVAQSCPILTQEPLFQLRDEDRSGFDASDGPTFLSLSIEHRVAFPTDLLPKRYGTDKEGRRVLIGLSVEETFEFETLDDFSPLDETGTSIAWRDGVPITNREKRWLDLYQKHEDAWRKLLADRVVRPQPR